MKVKFGFKVLDVKIEDVTFKVKEMDYAELRLNNSYTKDNVTRVRLADAITEFFNTSVIDWDGLVDEATNNNIKFSDEAKKGLPFTVKTLVFNETLKLAQLPVEEKKS
jgi:hypothetical protein